MQNILGDSENCIELDLPVTNVDAINSMPVKVLSCADSNIQEKIKKDKPKSKRRGYTTIISSSEYKENLLCSKSKRQPKRPKNSSQPLALASNAVNVQVPVQFVQYSMMPVPFQSHSEIQVTNSTLNGPANFFHLKEAQMMHNVPIQKNPGLLSTRPTLIPAQNQPSRQIFTPRAQSSSLIIRPVHRQIEMQPVKPTQQSSVTIRPVFSRNQVQSVFKK